MDLTRTITDGEEDGARERPTAAQFLVVALDCARPLAPPVRLRLDERAVVIGRSQWREWRRLDGVLRLGLPDARISTEHARVVAEAGGWVLEDMGSKNGTFRHGVRVNRVPLVDGDVFEVGTTLLVFRALTVTGLVGDEAPSPPAAGAVVPRTVHPPWSSALATLLRVGHSATPVLLVGETGTGKEVLARAVHAASGRSGPFVPVNCGAIVPTLIESELFGVRKGAFSGAGEDRAGLVRSADGGTLFLDEIAELPPTSQTALLRVLQEREVLPVGATRAVAVDLRVVAATHQDLAARVADGRFRADLHSRLIGHITRVPPLRDRIEDIGLLVGELLQRLAAARVDRLSLSRAAGRALLAHRWPYNVRQLEQALQSALAIATGDEIALAHLPESLRAPSPALPATTSTSAPAPPLEVPADEAEERGRIVAALESCAWNQTRAAKALGISRATLVTKLAIHHIPRPRKR